MPDAGTAKARRSLGKGRLEAFSDGVFSIAATLLVFNVAVHPPGTPLEQVLQAWPAYFGYLVSFSTIGAAWLAHSALTDRLERTDSLFVRLNLLVLMVIAFLPFPTGLVADALYSPDSERVAVTVYGLTLLTIRLLASALTGYAQREHLFKAQDEGMELHREGRELLPVVAAYVIAILIGLVVPLVSVALYFAIAVFMVVPFRQISRLLFKRA